MAGSSIFVLFLCACALCESVESVPPQLNVTAFTNCFLSSCASNCSIDGLKKKYDFALDDGLLLYLSLYAGIRIPFLNSTQQKAYVRWCQNYWEQGSKLAYFLLKAAQEKKVITPDTVIEGGFDAGCSDIFCVTLIAQNVLRTLGRWPEEKSFNAPWFENNKTEWVETYIPLISNQMIPLETKGYVLEERWGSWYHSFGLFLFGIHEMVLFGEEIGDDLDKFVVIMNKLLNPFLAGGPENPVKHEIDQQSVEVIFNVVKKKGSVGTNCDNSKGYVNQL